MQRFSDFSEEKATLEGNRICIEDILNYEIVINDYSITKSKFNKGNGNYLTIQIILKEEKRVIFTGSEILMKQIEKYRNKLPFLSVIKRINKYYTFT